MRWRWWCASWLAERVIRAGRTTVGWICAAFGLPDVRLYRWVDGVPVDLADVGVAARAGGLLGRLHACAPLTH
jgi:hypothetical protein